jgi:hypothetical protein
MPAHAAAGFNLPQLLRDVKKFEDSPSFSKQSIDALLSSTVSDRIISRKSSSEESQRERQNFKRRLHEKNEGILEALNNEFASLAENYAAGSDAINSGCALPAAGVSFPGPRSQEAIGSQPLNLWILEKLAEGASRRNYDCEVENANDTKRHSPAKNVSREIAPVVGIAGPSSRGKVRIGEFTVAKVGKLLWVYSADTLPIVIQIKALYRADTSWKKLAETAVQQAVNHMSSFLSMCLNFAGTGLNGHATSATGSRAYVKVIHLELVGMGTSSCKLQLRETCMYPLMSKHNFTKWANSNNRAAESNEFEDLSNIFYPGCDNNDNQIPLTGFGLMYQLIIAPTEELFGQLWRNDNSSSDKLGTLLGIRTFDYVLRRMTKTAVPSKHHDWRELDICPMK